MTDTILYVTVVMAVLCTILSSALSVYFWGHRKKPLGIAVCAMLAGEALGMLVVSIFATLELLRTLEHFDPLTASSIRWVAIAATACSSIHLACRVRQILTSHEV